jgi:hypothetical protein
MKYTTPVESTLVLIAHAKTQDFTVRVVSKGQKYGHNNCLTHESLDPLVEFYATKYTGEAFGCFGQFCSRLRLSQLLESASNPWHMDLSIDSWYLTADEMDSIKVSLQRHLTPQVLA